MGKARIVQSLNLLKMSADDAEQRDCLGSLSLTFDSDAPDVVLLEVSLAREGEDHGLILQEVTIYLPRDAALEMARFIYALPIALEADLLGPTAAPDKDY